MSQDEKLKPGIQIKWGTTSSYSGYNPIGKEITIGRRYIKEDKAPAVLAHELAHMREELAPGLYDTPEEVFLQELYVWKSAMEQGLSPDEIDEDLIGESLGSYLQMVEEYYGKGSKEFKLSQKAFREFKKKYLGGK